jgi:redox-sensing transcriptional repressor
VGNLGRAILTYGGFAPEGFSIVEAFDANPEIVGQCVGELVVRDVKELPDILHRSPVDIGIVAVPAAAAQGVIDTLVSCGTKAILNYAPIAARVHRDIRMRYIDPVLALQSMTFYLKSAKVSAR